MFGVLTVELRCYHVNTRAPLEGASVKPLTKAVRAAHKAAEDLAKHPNHQRRIKARALALVAVVNVCDGSQTEATKAMGYKDRQLINRQVRRAVERGWVSWETVDGRPQLVTNVELPRQTEFSDVVPMEHHPAGKPPILPPFSLPEPYAY